VVGEKAAVKVTTVPGVKLAEQLGPQLIPAGDEVTVSVPVPENATDKVSLPEN
jgi:hypothetical protein